jgi:hypothetical protein
MALMTKSKELAYNNLLLSLFSNKHHEILHWVAPQRGIPFASPKARVNFKNTPTPWGVTLFFS